MSRKWAVQIEFGRPTQFVWLSTPGKSGIIQGFTDDPSKVFLFDAEWLAKDQQRRFMPGFVPGWSLGMPYSFGVIELQVWSASRSTRSSDDAFDAWIKEYEGR